MRLTTAPASSSALLAALLLATGLLMAGCDLIKPGDDEGGAEADVTVMTRNLYLGADLFVLLEAQNTQELIARAGQLYNTVLATDFPTRAGALAAEIEAAGPALIGLQEVSLYRVQAPSDFLQNPGLNADSVAFDFLAILQDSLAARGLSYDVAASVENADVELPAATDPGDPGALIDVRLTDRDVILARSDVRTEGAVTATYDAVLPLPVAGGLTIPFVRGYAQIEAEVGGASFVFANTHLEVGSSPEAAAVQEAQAQALIDALAEEGGPVVLVGDFNSAADGSSTGSYALLTDTYADAFAQAGAGTGFTCCHQPDLQNETPFTAGEERIDLVLYRGAADALSAEVVGEEPGDRAGGLWPSDHAGVVAQLRIGD